MGRVDLIMGCDGMNYGHAGEMNGSGHLMMQEGFIECTGNKTYFY
jgi:hypothetical protein